MCFMRRQESRRHTVKVLNSRCQFSLKACMMGINPLHQHIQFQFGIPKMRYSYVYLDNVRTHICINAMWTTKQNIRLHM